MGPEPREKKHSYHNKRSRVIRIPGPEGFPLIQSQKQCGRGKKNARQQNAVIENGSDPPEAVC